METITCTYIGIVCKTPCPHKHLGKSGNLAYVGSGSCAECPHFRGYKNLNELVKTADAVYCAFNEK